MRLHVVAVAVSLVGCNELNGLGGLEKVDCVGDCAPTGGAGGSAGGAGAAGPGGAGAGGAVATPPPVGVFAMGRYITCALSPNTEALCWGSGLPGDLRTTTPALIPELAGTDRIALGDSHGCFLVNNATFCWGRNDRGQLGNGTFETSWEPTPVLGPGGVGTLDNVRRLTRGRDFTCAQTLDNEAYCWGDNSHGQLGNGTTTDSPIPVLVILPDNVNKVSGGSDFACAALSDTRVFCWGRNHRGQLGLDMTDDLPHPNAALVAGVNAEKTFGGGDHMCALTASGTAACWGAGDQGQLGDGMAQDSAVPVPVTGLTSVEGISPGMRHTCSITADGAFCWGANDYGQLSNDSVGAFAAAPVVPGNPELDGTLAIGVESGGEHVCSVSGTDGRFWCWGLNDSGQIGNGEVGGVAPPTVIGTPP